MYSQKYSLAPANYSDYRDFLKNRFLELKKSKKMSLQSCARRSKISRSLLQFLFNKKRHASLDKIPDLSKALKMTPEEEYFIYLMLCKNSSKNSQVKEHFERIISRIRNQYVVSDIGSVPKADESVGDIYRANDLLLPMLKAAIGLSGFQEDPRWLAQKFVLKNLTEKDVATSLRKLEEIQSVTRDQEGRLVLPAKADYRPDPYDPNAQLIYHNAAASMAELLKHPELYRPSVYSSMSLAMDEENLAKAEKHMIEVHHYLNKLASESQSPVCVVQVGNFLLNVAHIKNHILRK